MKPRRFFCMAPKGRIACGLGLALLLGAGLVQAACSNPLDGQHVPDRPLLPGEVVAITGGGFGKMAGGVYFPSIDGGQTLAPIYEWRDDHVSVRVPDDAGPGTVQVSGSQSADNPILRFQVRVKQARKALRRVVVRVAPSSAVGTVPATVIALDGSGAPLEGVRVMITTDSIQGGLPSFFLTGANGVANVMVGSNLGGYSGTISLGSYYVYLDRRDHPFTEGEVAIAEHVAVTAATTQLSVSVHTSSASGAARPGDTVFVFANQCATALGAGNTRLTTDDFGAASGTIVCPHPAPGLVTVDAIAPGTGDNLQLEVRP